MSVPMVRMAAVLLGVLGVAGNLHAKSLAEVAREDAERRAKLAAAADKGKAPKPVYDAAALAGARGANMSQLDGSGMPPVAPAATSMRDLGQPLDATPRAAATPPTPQPPVSRAQAAERCIDAPLGAAVGPGRTPIQLLEEAQKNAGKRQRICASEGGGGSLR
jgi:hypothetical protein